jgi:hypothetical protein
MSRRGWYWRVKSENDDFIKFSGEVIGLSNNFWLGFTGDRSFALHFLLRAKISPTLAVEDVLFQKWTQKSLGPSGVNPAEASARRNKSFFASFCSQKEVSYLPCLALPCLALPCLALPQANRAAPAGGGVCATFITCASSV